MKYLSFISALLLFFSCGNKSEEATTEEQGPKEDYEHVENQHYRSFYGGNNQLKMEGHFDDQGNRHGVWTYFFPDGKKQSITEYKHGKKDGFTIVYHENGSVYYKGEYLDDQMVGVWDYYDTSTGQKASTKDYGYPETAKK